MTSNFVLADVFARSTSLDLGPGIGVHPGRSAKTTAPARATIPPSFASLADALVHYASTRPDADAFFFVDVESRLTSFTYGELFGVAQQFASMLRARGAGPGDAVAISLERGAEVLGAFFGCVLVGALPFIAEPPLGMARLRAWPAHMERMLAMASSRYAIVAERLASALPSIDPGEDGARPRTTLTPRDLPSTYDPFVRPPHEPEGVAFLQFTSGTTGDSRAVVIPHRALLANCRGMSEIVRWNDGDAYVAWIPVFHDMGLVCATLLPFLHGSPSVLLDALAFLFRPSRWLWAISHFRGTFSSAPNFGYQLCTKKVSDAELVGLDLGSWRYAMNAAEFVHVATIQRFSELFAPYGFSAGVMKPCYGMAEAVVGVTLSPSDDIPPRIDRVLNRPFVEEGRAVAAGDEEDAILRFVACGQVMAGHDVLVVDEHGNPVPDRTRGQIVIRGPSLTRGYLADAAATARVFRDGWFCTGDLGYLANNDLFLCGRSKDLIIRAGRNYHPETLETCAAHIEGVRPGCVAAVGLADAARGTEEVVVVFETRETSPAAIRKLCDLIDARLLAEVGLRPDRIIPLPPRTLPKTSSGKMPHAHIAALVAAGELGKVSWGTPAEPAATTS